MPKTSWSALAASFVTTFLLAPAVLAAPGDPLADGSCTFLGERQKKCEERIVKGLVNALGKSLKCHQAQAKAAGRDLPFDDACELAATRGLRKFSAGCDPEVVRAATGLDAELDALLDGLVNGSLYCDAASGTPIDGSADETGFVPATAGVWRCAAKLEGATRKLGTGTLKCFPKEVRAAFRSKPFDLASCLGDTRDAFDATSLASILGACPPCMENGRPALADGIDAYLRTTRARTYPCLTGFYLRGGSSLEEAQPTAPLAARETVRRVNRDEAAVFPTFTSAPFADAATLDAATLVVLHLGANQEMKGCADVQVLVERIAPNDARTTLGTSITTELTIPAATAKPLLPMGVDLTLTDTSVPAGSRPATTVTVTNRCPGNRAISLDYDNAATPTRLVTTPQ